MKVTIDEKTKLSKIIYPCILKDSNSNLLVIATGSSTGTCLSDGFGWRKGDWSDAWDFDEFIRLDGSVTLEND